jgi:hypothetical protein
LPWLWDATGSLLDEMKPLNDHAYSLAGYFDKTDPQTLGASIKARRD